MATETKNTKAFYNTEIPSDWEVVKSGEVIKYFGGNAFSSDDACQSGIKWLKIANVGIETTKWDEASYLPEEFIITNKKYLLQEGDVVMALTRPILDSKLKIAKIKKEDTPCLLNQRVAKLITQKNLDNFYAYHVIQMPYFINRMNVAMAGTDPPNLGSGDLEKIKIPLPPLPEQIAIAKVLGKMDEAINANNQLIAQKALRKKWLMQNLLTGKKRLKGFGGEWKEVKLGAFLKESRIKGNLGDIAKKITVKLYGNGVFAKSDKTKGSKNTQYFIRKSDQFIYSKLDFLNGAFGIIPQELNDYESTLDLPCFDINTLKVNKAFLLSFVTRKDFYKRYDDGAIGGRKAKRIQVTEFLNIKPQFPALQEQTAIAQILQAVDKELSLLKAKTEKLKEQKKGMMQVLLTGKKRLNQDLQDLNIYRINALEHNLESPANSESPNPNNNLENPKNL
jgi:type I restriction enzyme S subunit